MQWKWRDLWFLRSWLFLKGAIYFFKITVEFKFVFWRGHDPLFAQFVVLCNIASCGSNWWTFKIIFPRLISWISKLWLIKNHSSNTILWKIFYLFCTESLRCSICQMLIGGKGLECDQSCDSLGCFTLHLNSLANYLSVLEPFLQWNWHFSLGQTASGPQLSFVTLKTYLISENCNNKNWTCRYSRHHKSVISDIRFNFRYRPK